MADEKLQKVLANLGLGSRREIEDKIARGLVKVNGEIAHLGQRVSSKDLLMFEGKKVNQPTPHNKPNPEVILYYKPVGQICTRKDPELRPTIFEYLPRPKGGRWISIGRLDINSEGLIMLTTDGELANRLMHPSYEIQRIYAARVRGKLDDAMMEKLTKGVELEDGLAKFEEISYHAGTAQNHWYHVTLKEGRFREVRRLFETVGMQVARLIRIQYGPIVLPRELEAGQYTFLDKKAMADLRASVGLEEQE